MKRIVYLFIFLVFFSFFSTVIFAGKIDIVSFRPKNMIVIESQTYISKYIDWSFSEINNTHWIATWKWNDLKIREEMFDCVNETEKTKCEKDLHDNYFSKYPQGQIVSDIEHLKNRGLPIKAVTKNIKFLFEDIPLTNDSGSFYIYFPDGFKAGEKAEFGFGTTKISTSTIATQDAFDSNIRGMCVDGNDNIHLAWLSTDYQQIAYARSSNMGSTWTTNASFTEAVNVKYWPWISCDGNNITVAYYDEDDVAIKLAISEDNGVIWSWQDLSYIGTYFVAVERRGQNIHMIYENDTFVHYLNSTDGGTSFHTPTTIMSLMSSGGAEPSMAVDGTGGEDDKIYVVASGVNADTTRLMFVNSTDSGATWGANATIWDSVATSMENPSITFNNTELFVACANFENNPIVYFGNSTDSGISWTTPYTLNSTGNIVSSPIVTTDRDGYPFVAWYENTTGDGEYNIVYKRYNGSWSSITNLTNDATINKFPIAPYQYRADNKIYLSWINGTESPFDIMFDYVVSDSTAPKYYTNQSSIPTYYNPNTLSEFNITVNTTEGDMSVVLIEMNYSGTATNYTMTNTTYGGDIYNFSIILPVNASYWKVYMNNTIYNWNSTPMWNFTISKNATNPVKIGFSVEGGGYQNNTNVSLESSTDIVTTAGWNLYSNSGTTSLFYNENNSVNNPDSRRSFTAGTWPFKVNTSGNTNYSGNATGLTFYVTAPSGGGAGTGGGIVVVIELPNQTFYVEPNERVILIPFKDSFNETLEFKICSNSSEDLDLEFEFSYELIEPLFDFPFIIRPGECRVAKFMISIFNFTKTQYAVAGEKREFSIGMIIKDKKTGSFQTANILLTSDVGGSTIKYYMQRMIAKAQWNLEIPYLLDSNGKFCQTGITVGEHNFKLCGIPYGGLVLVILGMYVSYKLVARVLWEYERKRFNIWIPRGIAFLVMIGIIILIPL